MLPQAAGGVTDTIGGSSGSAVVEGGYNATGAPVCGFTYTVNSGACFLSDVSSAAASSAFVSATAFALASASAPKLAWRLRLASARLPQQGAEGCRSGRKPAELRCVVQRCQMVVWYCHCACVLSQDQPTETGHLGLADNLGVVGRNHPQVTVSENFKTNWGQRRACCCCGGLYTTQLGRAGQGRAGQKRAA